MTFIAILGLCITIASFLFGDGLLDKYVKKIRRSYSNAQRKTSNREMGGRGMVRTRNGNHIWKAKKFIDVTKNAETEDLIYKEGFIRFNIYGEESFLVI